MNIHEKVSLLKFINTKIDELTEFKNLYERLHAAKPSEHKEENSLATWTYYMMMISESKVAKVENNPEDSDGVI